MAWWNPLSWDDEDSGDTLPKDQIKKDLQTLDVGISSNQAPNRTQNVDTFEDPTTGLTPAESAPAEPAGPSPADKYRQMGEEWDVKSDELFGNAMKTFDSMGENVDKNLQLQLDSAGDKRAQAQRRGIESGALQGGSGFGGMQAGKDLQAGMYGDQLANQAYQNALESKLGIEKGRIGAFLERSNKDLTFSQDMLARAPDQESKDYWNGKTLEMQGKQLEANIWSSLLANPEAYGDIDQGAFQSYLDELLAD
jgi:hypothetical protein